MRSQLFSADPASLIAKVWYHSRPISQIPECTCLLHIPHSEQKCAHGALWEIEQVHSGICEIVLSGKCYMAAWDMLCRKSICLRYCLNTVSEYQIIIFNTLRSGKLLYFIWNATKFGFSESNWKIVLGTGNGLALEQATSHYLNQCWPWSQMPYGIISPQWSDINFEKNFIIT